MKKLPFIIIFDVEYTIVGDVDEIMYEWNVLEYIYNICKKKGIHAKCFSSDLVDMQDELKNGLLRPYVSDFIRFCNTKFKNAEVFLYTNNGYSWMNQVLGKNIEKALKIKINRPFLTAHNSMKYDSKKSIANTFPIIIKSLTRKYPSLKDEAISEYVLNNRTILIDNTMSEFFTYTERHLICPKYNFSYEYDIYDKLIRKYKLSPEIFDDKDILQYMHERKILVYNVNGNDFQKNKEYIAIAKMYHTLRKEIKKSQDAPTKEDTYFKDLIQELSKNKIRGDSLTGKDITAINKKLFFVQSKK
jgi:hypothetical protein